MKVPMSGERWAFTPSGMFDPDVSPRVAMQFVKSIQMPRATLTPGSRTTTKLSPTGVSWVGDVDEAR